ncbi:DUF1684 domain-containing protein [Mucilaginibacter calamicampi]|uniref:DUF1684 domain-containing protein n=1 Tax=Mucilaginibacter calamicampi TaxID=1302352 RepID=A0ABW2YY24_9SPHI
MRYLTLLLLLTTFACFAQDHNAQITAFREKYKNDFLTEKNSPIKKEDLPYLRFYKADSTYRVTAKVEKIPGPNAFMMPMFTGAAREYLPYAKLKFSLNGKALELTVYRSTALMALPEYKDYLFLPFTDETNGNDTYGGGRYIDLREAEFKDNLLVLDFNKAYNPYCAFSNLYSCPKPPDENKLAVAIKAGEKLFGKGH